MLSPTNMTDLSTGLSRAGRKIITGSSTKHKQSLCRHTSSPITCKYSPPSQKEKILPSPTKGKSANKELVKVIMSYQK